MFFVIIGLAFSITSCADNTPENDGCNEVFFSSFENLKDLQSFEGYGFYRSDDVTSDAGDSSLVVCGGCIGPHLYFDIGPFEDSKELKLDFMAKVESNQSAFTIYQLGGVSTGQQYIVSDTVWTHYQPEETFLLPAEQTLRVEFFSGGIFALNTYYDLFTICEEIE